MLNIENLTELTIPLELLENIAHAFTTREIDLTLCYNDTIQAYNREYRQKDQPTDVLSFPIENEFVIDENSVMPLGSIVISADYVQQKADELGHSNKAELTLLFIHGLLHILGYDHEVDSGEMREKEMQLIQEFNLPKSLIVRTEEY